MKMCTKCKIKRELSEFSVRLAMNTQKQIMEKMREIGQKRNGWKETL